MRGIGLHHGRCRRGGRYRRDYIMGSIGGVGGIGGITSWVVTSPDIAYDDLTLPPLPPSPHLHTGYSAEVDDLRERIREREKCLSELTDCARFECNLIGPTNTYYFRHLVT